MPFTFTMPKLSPTMEEGVIAKWHKKEGDYVEENTVLIEVTTDKATIEHNVLDAGWLRKILIKEGESAQVNQAIAIFTAEKEESIEGYKPEEELPKKEKAPLPETPSHKRAKPSFKPPPSSPPSARMKVSPLAKKLAEEKGLDLSTIHGTGPGGRIIKRDLEKAQSRGMEAPSIPSGTYEEIPLTPMRKVIAQRLQESKSFIPHYYLTKKINASAMVAMREQLKNVGLSITFNDMVIRAAALALKEHKEVNSGFHSEHETIIAYQTIDISVAVSIPDGLITPIIQHADYKNLDQISTEVKALAKKAKEGKLKEEEYRGGSFCISNLGMFGLDSFAAVINPPQAAILAVGAIVDEPIVQDGQLAAGKTLILTLSADHRVVDGAEGAQFLKTLGWLLENPVSLAV